MVDLDIEMLMNTFGRELTAQPRIVQRDTSEVSFEYCIFMASAEIEWNLTRLFETKNLNILKSEYLNETIILGKQFYVDAIDATSFYFQLLKLNHKYYCKALARLMLIKELNDDREKTAVYGRIIQSDEREVLAEHSEVLRLKERKYSQNIFNFDRCYKIVEILLGQPRVC